MMINQSLIYEKESIKEGKEIKLYLLATVISLSYSYILYLPFQPPIEQRIQRQNPLQQPLFSQQYQKSTMWVNKANIKKGAPLLTLKSFLM